MSNDDGKPDPSYFIAMRQVREGETNRCDEFLPSANPYGILPRQKKEPVRKWKPTATTENTRPDEWMGAGPKAARSWKVKSVSIKPPSNDSSDSDSDDGDDDDDGKNKKAPDLGESKPSNWKSKPVERKVEPAPTPASTPAVEPEPQPELQPVSNYEESEVEVQSDTEVEVQSDTEVEVQSDTEVEVESDDEGETAVKPEPPKKQPALLLKKKQPALLKTQPASPKKKTEWSPKKKTSETTFEKIERPDATAFRNAMRMEQDAGASHIDEYLPSAHEGSSRKRGEPAVRKWKPTSTTANSRPDDWLGASSSSSPSSSATTTARSWKPKAPPSSGDNNDNGAPVNAHPLIQSSMSTAPKWTKPSPTHKVGIPSAFSSSPSRQDANNNTSVAAPSFSAKKNQESDHDNSQGSLSASFLQKEATSLPSKRKPNSPNNSQESLSASSLRRKGESDFEDHFEPEQGEAPIKQDDGPQKEDTNKKAMTPHHNRMWKSSSGFDYSNTVVVSKPDPSAFLAMRQVRQGDTSRCNEFLPSANPYGISPRQKKEPVRKWKPTATTENSRPDEWMGGGPKATRSWKVKSVSTKPPRSDSGSDDDDDDDDDDKNNETVNSIPTWKAKAVEKAPEPAPTPVAAAPVATPAHVAKEQPMDVTVDDDDDHSEVEVQSDTEVEVQSEDEEEAVKNRPESPKKEAPSAKPEPPKKHDAPKVEIQRPDAESFRNTMRHVREGETTRVDEFLPSGNPYGTSPRKRSEPVKRWKPTATAENSRPDEWMGSGKKPKARSWTVKSVSTKPPSTDGNDGE